MALNQDVALAVGVWVEALLYGIYTCLFFEAFYVILKRRSRLVNSANVFLAGTLVMYLLATAHMVVNLYRFIRAFVLHLNPQGPFYYLFDFSRWDNLVHNSMLCIMTWLGDGLVIYRCYIIWDRKIWVTILPVILLILSISSNVALLFWFTHPGSQTETEILQWMATIYPFAFAQNTLTTGMIAFKIWRQHHASTTVGIRSSSRLDLLGVMRIVIESAMVYTLQLLILIILFPLHHNAQLILQSAVIPSIGIVFVLIAVRVQFSRSRALFGETAMSTMPPWLDVDTSTRVSSLDLGQRGSQPSVLMHGLGDDAQEKRELPLLDFVKKPGRPRGIGQSVSAP
ncbi:hypothetical protein GALMADRAFT_103355 [Galerina marginata CBS 339.88]|uniref:Uncharacterized protein n=1 Tax=Galerina marginata (strain CBS 339.88) TaxID=685588 RepID=A0A067STV0_GALM3|nr:hypothetical protein GALMADRAFT_103355 [Galerina marginata CBS 339.88]